MNYYAFFESSGVNRGVSDSLTYILPVFESCYCVEFKYYMYGKGIGLLNVTQDKAGNMTTLFSKKGGN